MKRAAVLMIAIGCVTLAAVSMPASIEALSCSDSIPAGSGTVVANSDATGCGTGQQIIVQGPGTTLDLNGHKVTCTGTPTTGIQLVGSGAVLKNGLVQGCTFGVEVTGTGGHKVQSVVAKQNGTGPGFNVLSNKNELTNSSAVLNAIGFLVSGNQNKLDKDVATDSPGPTNFDITGNENTISNSVGAYGVCHGFRISGDKNKLTNNTATGTTSTLCDGFRIELGSSLNEFNGNVASDNEGNGFNDAGNTNKLTGNIATGNDLFGFFIDGSSNQVLNNTAVRNDSGIVLGGNLNLVKGNRTQGNEFDGIRIRLLGSNNTVTENIALGNGDKDLKDLNTDCDSNSWTKDIFGTSDPSGVSAICIH